MISVNGTKIEPTIFPDKTSQIWKIPPEIINSKLHTDILWAFESESEIFHLCQLMTLLRAYRRKEEYHLNIPFLPYGRQDKNVSNHSTFALTAFATILNSLTFNSVSTIDPHSNVAVDLILNLKITYPLASLYKAAGACDSDLFCYPDEGAFEKYKKIYSHPFIHGEKVRDQSTGYITSYNLVNEGGEMDIRGQKILIVDDICDGGATFTILAKSLYDAGVADVNLFVSHGIFSKGLEVLKQAKINRIFTKEGEVK